MGPSVDWAGRAVETPAVRPARRVSTGRSSIAAWPRKQVPRSIRRATLGCSVSARRGGRGGAADREGGVAPRVVAWRAAAAGTQAMSSPVVGPGQIQRAVLPHGLRLLTVDRPGSGMVAPQSLITAGSLFDGDRPGLARFAAATLQRGTRGLSARELAEQMDGLGATLAMLPGAEGGGVAGRMLSEGVSTYLRLGGEGVTAPSFSPPAGGEAGGR